MSYYRNRDNEQLRLLDEGPIKEFINRYNNSNGPSAGPRQTVILFPGGMASMLQRAKRPWQKGGGSSQQFNYDTVWADPATLLGGGALDLALKKEGAGKYRDKGNRIIVADGPLGYLGCTPYTGFSAWCDLKGLDWFIFGWDWRRRIQESGTFFVKKFLPHFQQQVKNGCNNADPLANFTLIGHSAGGMVVNWILRKNHPNVANMQRAITVATPFYGYKGQVHRWFEGDPLVNGPLGIYKDGIIKVICSLPGCYALQFLDNGTYLANQVALKADLKYPLNTYPSVDATNPANAADPYNPQPDADSRYPSPGATGFDVNELAAGKKLVRYLASPLSPALAAKFINIRGDNQATDTIGSTRWKLVPPTSPTPIADGPAVPGDGTQPAWTARLVGPAAPTVITVKGFAVEHMFIMNSPKVLVKLAGVLGV